MSAADTEPEALARVELRADVVEALGFFDGKHETGLRRVAQIAATALNVKQSALIVFRGREPVVVTCFGRGVDSLHPVAQLCALVVRSERTLIIEDVRSSRECELLQTDGEQPLGMFAAIPIRSPTQQIIIGAFCVYESGPRSLGIAQQRLLGECAGLIEDELRLRQLTVRDELTGLLNRREFDLHLGAAWRRARREGGSLAVAILDIDYFKRVNDRFGHAEGDKVLQSVAKQCSKGLRSDMDVVGRYGGEEFAMSLPGLSTALATQRMQALCERIRDQRIPNPDAPLAVLTVSIGIAVLERTQDFECVSMERLLLHADEALYAAKNSGRARVCVHRYLPNSSTVAVAE